MKANNQPFASLNISTISMRCVNESTLDASGAFAQELEESGLAPPALASIGSVALSITYFVQSENQRTRFVEPWLAPILGLSGHLKPDGKTRLLQQRGTYRVGFH